MENKIVIIDYGLGNPLSIKNMLKKAGFGKVLISKDSAEIASADKLILPGVGHFAKGMENLHAQGLVSLLNELVLEKKIPILGICLGMQLMTQFSEEGACNGLGWLEAQTIKFNFEDKNMKIPHMGWNDTCFLKKPFTELAFEENPPRFYYVHSYYVHCENDENILCTAEYGTTFTSGFVKENIMGVQFHPEKSHVFGKELLKAFASL